MKKTKPLSPEMQRAVEVIKQHGALVRYQGGFWAKPNDELAGHFPAGMSGINPEELNYPLNSIGTNTVKSLIARGVVKVTETKKSSYGEFPVKVELNTEAK